MIACTKKNPIKLHLIRIAAKLKQFEDIDSFTTSSHNLDLYYEYLVNDIQQTVNSLLLNYIITCKT